MEVGEIAKTKKGNAMRMGVCAILLENNTKWGRLKISLHFQDITSGFCQTVIDDRGSF